MTGPVADLRNKDLLGRYGPVTEAHHQTLWRIRTSTDLLQKQFPLWCYCIGCKREENRFRQASRSNRAKLVKQLPICSKTSACNVYFSPWTVGIVACMRLSPNAVWLSDFCNTLGNWLHATPPHWQMNHSNDISTTWTPTNKTPDEWAIHQEHIKLSPKQELNNVWAILYRFFFYAQLTKRPTDWTDMFHHPRYWRTSQHALPTQRLRFCIIINARFRQKMNTLNVYWNGHFSKSKNKTILSRH